jgi:hypothetical protein
MRSPDQHESDAMDFVSRAFTSDEQSADLLAAGKIEATLAVAAALSELAAVLAARD